MNDFQNAYAMSGLLQWEANDHVWERAAAEVARGQFPVVQTSVAYCRYTDATLRTPRATLVGVYRSRAEAEAAVARELAAANEELIDCYVYPRDPTHTPTTTVYDDIPF